MHPHFWEGPRIDLKSNLHYSKPLPQVLPETEEFWKAAKRHELYLQRCKSCGNVIYFPRIVCPRCMSDEIEWFRASGRGTLYSYTIIRQAADPRFEQDVPYVYAIIELEEGVRMISNLVNVKFEKIRIGMNVKVLFEDVTPEISIPKFQPA